MYHIYPNRFYYEVVYPINKAYRDIYIYIYIYTYVYIYIYIQYNLIFNNKYNYMILISPLLMLYTSNHIQLIKCIDYYYNSDI